MRSRLRFFRDRVGVLSVIGGLVGCPRSVVIDRAPGRRTGFTLDPGHPWRPPFGLERIGRPVVIVVEAGARPDAANYLVTAFSKGKQGASYPVRFPTEAPYSARVTLDRDADEVVFSSDRKPPEKPVELARQAIRFPDIRGRIDRPARRDHQPRRPGNDSRPFGLAAAGPGADGDARRRPRSAAPRTGHMPGSRHDSRRLPPRPARLHSASRGRA